MGNICDCLNQQKESEFPTPKTPLLTGGPQTTQPRGAPANNNGAGTRQSPGGASARTHRPPPDQDEFLSSLQVLTSITLVPISTLPSLDKTFQDHAKLYNDLHASFVNLQQGLHDFKAKFAKETAGIPIIAECLKLLNHRCGGATLSGSRQKNCIQITYDRREVSQRCRGPAEDVLETLELYNRLNILVKNVLEKAPKVKSTIALVLEEEAKLKRELTKADPDGKQGPQPMKNANENFAKLHKLPEYIDTIYKYTTKTFKEIANGSKVLFEEKT